jgi:formylglycine-generating enzyme required for sulfatase activity
LLIVGIACGGFYDRFVVPAASAQTVRTPSSPDQILKVFVDECVLISPGTGQFPQTFTMGGLNGGPFSLPEKVVEMNESFRISKYEVTQELYQTVMGSNPSRWKGDRNSVEMVSFQDAQQFCARLTVILKTRKLIDDAEMVRLPAEAEWEYCCRAGTTSHYSFGDEATTANDQENGATVLSEYAWHTGNAAGNDPVVGSLKPNPWGLYDMHGSLWEFAADPYTVNPDSSGTASPNDNASAKSRNPGSPAASAARILRGGSWRDHYSLLTSNFRLAIPAHAASDAIGFRCVISK